MSLSEALVICEGYHDRAFWHGMLKDLGCHDAPSTQEGDHRVFRDPWNRPVRGGRALLSKSREFVSIRPANGKDDVCRTVRLRLGEHALQPLRVLVVNVDADTNADGTPSTSRGVSRAAVEDVVRQADPAAVADGKDFLVFGGTVCVAFTVWSATVPPSLGLPNQQTLERVISAALASVYPDRAAAVDRWLAARPNPPQPNPKEHAWSYLAGWYANRPSYEGFCTSIWNEPAVAAQLRRCLMQTDVWRVAELLAA
ncbi:MAG: hypothetical protein ABSH20_13550 [Tepidisphaeraceae bacterium]|jgi:hypothetical protein